MTRWHAHVVHMAKYMNVVGHPFPGPLALPKSGAAVCINSTFEE